MFKPGISSMQVILGLLFQCQIPGTCIGNVQSWISSM